LKFTSKAVVRIAGCAIPRARRRAVSTSYAPLFAAIARDASSSLVITESVTTTRSGGVSIEAWPVTVIRGMLRRATGAFWACAGLEAARTANAAAASVSVLIPLRNAAGYRHDAGLEKPGSRKVSLAIAAASAAYSEGRGKGTQRT
jgi:hypothetical protein